MAQDNGRNSRQDRNGGERPKAVRLLRNPWVKIAIGVVAVVIVAAVVAWWLISRNYETTDDAFVDTHIVHIAPQVAGQVTRVAVADNQLVREGAPLVEIDSAEAQTRLAQARAQEAQARTQLEQARAAERGAAAQALSAEHDLERYQLLARTAPQAVAQQQIDRARATFDSAAAQRRAAAAEIAGARAQIKALGAQMQAAQINLSYAHIVAPVEGYITQRSVAAGNYVSAGQDMMAIVPTHLWVTANFKETQLADMRPGQPVSIAIDACGGEKVAGHVDSIQRGAGQAFGILPPENATGNYVKVVQRVPVKIAIDRVPRDCVLGPGMSVEPSVTVR